MCFDLECPYVTLRCPTTGHQILQITVKAWSRDGRLPYSVFCLLTPDWCHLGLQGYAFQMEIVVRARKLGFAIAEARSVPNLAVPMCECSELFMGASGAWSVFLF